MDKSTLSKYSNSELVLALSLGRKLEREICAEVILLLSELDGRKLYRDEGYPSLFVYCKEALGYSESSAYRRQQAARMVQEEPGVYEKLRSGDLSLSAVVELSKTLKEEVGLSTGELVESASGKTKAQVQELVAVHSKAEPRKKDRIRPKKTRAKKALPLIDSHRAFMGKSTEPEVELKYDVSFEADAEFLQLFEEVRALVGGGRPPITEVLRKVLKEYKQRHCPRERASRRVKRADRAKSSCTSSSSRSQAPSGSRYIPRAVRDEVHLRDGGQCTYRSSTDKRCSCTSGLEVDHITPFAFTANNSAANLRLRCRAHNQLEAERVFGASFMKVKRRM